MLYIQILFIIYLGIWIIWGILEMDIYFLVVISKSYLKKKLVNRCVVYEI